MAKATIHLAFDFFFHRWDEPAEGALWLTVRPFVIDYPKTQVTQNQPPKLENFRDWLANSDFGDRFNYAEWPEDFECKAGEMAPIVTPVNLPSDMSVWLKTYRADDRSEEGRWQVTHRQHRNLQRQERVLGPLAPFAPSFNAMVRAKAKLDPEAPNPELVSVEDMAQHVAIHFYGGKTLDVDDIEEAFHSPAGGDAWAPNPVFKVKPFPQSREPQKTSAFWANGLMLRLGARADLDALRKINAFDLELWTGSKDLDPYPNGSKQFAICTPSLIEGENDEPLNQFPTKWFPAIPEEFRDDIGVKVTAPEKNYYYAPVARAFAKAKEKGAGRNVRGGSGGIVWRLEVAEPEKRDRSARAKAHGTGKSGLPRLHALAAADVMLSFNTVDEFKTANLPKQIELWPGFRLLGQVKPYRGFPALTAEGRKAPRAFTLMEYLPDAESKQFLNWLLSGAGEDVKTIFDRLAKSAQLVTETPGESDAWEFTSLTKESFAWDEGASCFIIFAEPRANSSDVNAEALRTLSGGMIEMAYLYEGAPTQAQAPILATPLPPRAMWVAELDKQGRGSSKGKKREIVTVTYRTLLPKPDGQLSPAILSDFWRGYAGGTPIFNMFWAAVPETNHASLADSSISTLQIDEYAFSFVNSSARYERDVTVTSPPFSEADLTPIHDFKGDLMNYNSLRLLERGKARPEIVMATSTSPCENNEASRNQTIPLLVEVARSPDDYVPGTNSETVTGTVTWQNVRQNVMGLLSADPNFHPTLDLYFQHTYGAWRSGVRENATPLDFKFSTLLDWPVTLLTHPARVNHEDNRLPNGVPELIIAKVRDTAKYTKGWGQGVYEIELELNPAILFFAFIDGGKLPIERNGSLEESVYQNAILAWRAVGEIAMSADPNRLRRSERSDGVLSILADRVRYELEFKPMSEGEPKMWKGGVPDAWEDALRSMEPVRPLNEDTAIRAIRDWAKELWEWKRPIEEARVTRIRLKFSNLSDIYLSRLRLEYKRPDKFAETIPAGLAPITPMVKTVTEDATQTRNRHWLKFYADEAPPTGAFANWHKSYLESGDSITPDTLLSVPSAPLTPATADGRNASVATAITAHLDGTDWFAPLGPALETKADVTPILTPFGFAPVAASPQFGSATQRVLQRFTRDLQDFIECRFPTNDSAKGAEQWSAHMVGLRALSKQYAAIVSGLAGLVFPLPPDSDATAYEVRNLIKAYQSAVDPPHPIRAAARAALTRKIATFADAKAFLVTMLEGQTVDNETLPSKIFKPLARGRFYRAVKDWKPLTPGTAPSTATPRFTQSTLGLEQLMFWPEAAGTTREKLAFFETLDDSHYDNRFDVFLNTPGSSVKGQFLDSFENLIDPNSIASARTFEAKAPVVPNTKYDRVDLKGVHLASRDLLLPPTHLFTSQIDAFRDALGDPSEYIWNLDGLRRGRLEKKNQLNQTLSPDLVIVAYASEKTGDEPRLPTQEFQLYTGVYAIYGDEEGVQNPETPLEALINEKFYFELVVQEESAALHKSSFSQEPPVENFVYKALNDLLGCPPRSGAAQQQLGNLLRAEQSVSALFGALAKPAPPPEKPAEQTWPHLAVDREDKRLKIFAGGGGVNAPWIKDAVLLQETSRAEGRFILVLNLAFRIWKPLSVALTQTRNFEGLNNSGDPEDQHFSSQFWQSALQNTAPVILTGRRDARNDRSKWRSKNRRLVIAGQSARDWRRKRTVIDLVAALLNDNSIGIGTNSNQPILTGSPLFDSDTSELNLSVTVYHEQFDDDADTEGFKAGPDSRFPIRNALFRKENLPEAPTGEHFRAELVWFPIAYKTFSVDFDWQTKAGASLLRLERVFVQFQ